jgi:y4mF family transcriptional regulator
MSQLGDRIRDRRTALELKQEDLAAKAGISKSFLSDLENGKSSVGAETLLDIARVLGVSLDALMTGAEMPTPDGEVQFPASLAALARQKNLTFVQALTLLDMQRQILAYRSATSKEVSLDDVDWLKFYESVKEFF